MTQAIQIKLLALILAVLVVIAGVVVHATRPVQLTPQERKDQQADGKKMSQAPDKPYLLP